MTNEVRRYKVRGVDGNINTVHAHEGTMREYVNLGLAVPSLPGNPNPAIYCDEDVIYGGYLFDPENDQEAMQELYGEIQRAILDHLGD
jgi:hypothetical protein